MKKVNNLNSSLFKKFKKEQVSNLSSIIGGYEPPTQQSSDVSSSSGECTSACSDVTTWADDSNENTDSSRQHD